MAIDLTSLNGSFENVIVNQNNIADYDQGERGIIANLSTAKVLIPVYEATKQPEIMALGDSLTSGEYPTEPTPGAYRLQLWNNFVDDDLSVDFIGSQENEGINIDDAEHEGHPGLRADELTALIDEGLLTNYQPDIVLLMAGSNDILKRSRRSSRVIDNLNQLVERLIDEVPDVQIFISSLPPVDPELKGNKRANTVDEVNALLPELAEGYGQQVTYVNAGGQVDVSDLVPDGTHPNEAGYQKIGNAWYDALVEHETLVEVDHITGTVYGDQLTGNAQANILFGNGGADILTGGLGADGFVYEYLDSEIDTITDFSVDDHILISASGFDAGLVSGTGLTEIESETGVFVSSIDPVPLGTGANFLYHTDTGQLSFDRDGIGSGTAVDLVNLAGMPPVSSEQIVIIA